MGKCVRISAGKYTYGKYLLVNCGYHHPDHCVWWEAIDIYSGCADFHAHTKKELMQLIDGASG